MSEILKSRPLGIKLPNVLVCCSGVNYLTIWVSLFLVRLLCYGVRRPTPATVGMHLTFSEAPHLRSSMICPKKRDFETKSVPGTLNPMKNSRAWAVKKRKYILGKRQTNEIRTLLGIKEPPPVTTRSITLKMCC